MNDNKMTPLERKATWGPGELFSLRMLGNVYGTSVLTTYGLQLQHATESLIGLAYWYLWINSSNLPNSFGFSQNKFGRKSMIVFGI